MMSSSPKDLISQWLQQRLSADAWAWLQVQQQSIGDDKTDKALFVALGMAPRMLGKAELGLDQTELDKAHAASAGWCPNDWSVAGAARILTLLTLAENKPAAFVDTLCSLCKTADVSEATTYYRAMDLFPNDSAFDQLIGDGLRTNMRAVFEAIAHNNPYPVKYFDEHRWNHMVLKALFIDSTLHPIQGLDARVNTELAQILCQYAHERWSAHRSVTPELWRCVGPVATPAMLDDLSRASQSSQPLEQQGALLALSQCPLPEARVLVDAHPITNAAIEAGEISWARIHAEL